MTERLNLVELRRHPDRHPCRLPVPRLARHLVRTARAIETLLAGQEVPCLDYLLRDFDQLDQAVKLINRPRRDVLLHHRHLVLYNYVEPDGNILPV